MSKQNKKDSCVESFLDAEVFLTEEFVNSVRTMTDCSVIRTVIEDRSKAIVNVLLIEGGRMPGTFHICMRTINRDLYEITQNTADVIHGSACDALATFLEKVRLEHRGRLKQCLIGNLTRKEKWPLQLKYDRLDEVRLLHFDIQSSFNALTALIIEEEEKWRDRKNQNK